MALTATILLITVLGLLSSKALCDNVDYKKEISVIENPLNDSTKLNSHTGFIGFTAYALIPRNYTSDEIVQFEGILLNEGGGYLPELGTFQCPQTGVYYVTVNAKSSSYSYMHLEVWKSSDLILYVNCPRSNNPWNVDSNSGLVRCEEGERIWVQSNRYSSYLWGDTAAPYTTFSVFLIDQNEATEFHDSVIGATAWKNNRQEYNTSDVIEFSEVLYNEGNHYRPEVNRFICPVTGIYYLAVHFQKHDIYALQLGVEQNNFVILHTSNMWGWANPYINLSNSRLLKCTQGDVLSVVGNGMGRIQGYGSLAASTFTVMRFCQQADVQSQDCSFIGFTSFKQSIQQYTTGAIIVFDGVLINEGNGYELARNRFVCPVSGIYYVTVTATKVLEEDLYLDVQQASRLLFRVEDNYSLNQDNMITNSALTRCFAGEDIKVIGSGDGAVYGDTVFTYTTFSTMLMYQY